VLAGTDYFGRRPEPQFPRLPSQRKQVLPAVSGSGCRKELALELGCPADSMGDCAKMNTWLLRTVLKTIADNGGNIPNELLD
jgi:hypothetical protein